ncbi:MAG: biotin--[acetyl-CoA-carboxylase] ligase [Acidobacteriota bacterium]|nr:MAG: biotin--[acetyl-CoA-carboxylase] ligase [Acidobacteriota bacterium]
MALARELAEAGAPIGTAVLAHEQTRGRGRRGRPFVSPRGGFYLTVIDAAIEPLSDAWRVGFAAALAAREALIELGGPEIQIDWPNDLLLGRGKVGGILTEVVSAGARAPGAAALPVSLIGIGLNIGPEPSASAPEEAGPARALPALACAEPFVEVAVALLARVELLCGRCRSTAGWRNVLESFRHFAVSTHGRRVLVHTGAGTSIEGTSEGIAEDGALLVRRADGRVERLRAGDMLRE